MCSLQVIAEEHSAVSHTVYTSDEVARFHVLDSSTPQVDILRYGFHNYDTALKVWVILS